MKSLYESLIQTMDDNRDKEHPCVGIFWYDAKNHKLVNAGDSLEYFKGTVTYNGSSDQYIVCVGSWIKEHDDAIELIVDEFYLNEVDYDFQIKEHWEIGFGWGY